MPLFPGKSKATFAHNVRTQVREGMPVDRAVAIAYREKGEKRKPKKR